MLCMPVLAFVLADLKHELFVKSFGVNIGLIGALTMSMIVYGLCFWSFIKWLRGDEDSDFDDFDDGEDDEYVFTDSETCWEDMHAKSSWLGSLRQFDNYGRSPSVSKYRKDLNLAKSNTMVYSRSSPLRGQRTYFSNRRTPKESRKHIIREHETKFSFDENDISWIGLGDFINMEGPKTPSYLGMGWSGPFSPRPSSTRSDTTGRASERPANVSLNHTRGDGSYGLFEEAKRHYRRPLSTRKKVSLGDPSWAHLASPTYTTDNSIFARHHNHSETEFSPDTTPRSTVATMTPTKSDPEAPPIEKSFQMPRGVLANTPRLLIPTPRGARKTVFDNPAISPRTLVLSPREERKTPRSNLAPSWAKTTQPCSATTPCTRIRTPPRAARKVVAGQQNPCSGERHVDNKDEDSVEEISAMAGPEAGEE